MAVLESSGTINSVIKGSSDQRSVARIRQTRWETERMYLGFARTRACEVGWETTEPGAAMGSTTEEA